MHWVEQFYSRQYELMPELCNGEVTDTHRKNACIIRRLAGGRTGRVLDLGAGGGQNASALADMGYSVVAIELVPSGAEHARKLASQPHVGELRVIEGDFYSTELPGQFVIVCYWDGFGIGSDKDQHRLLKRIAGWLSPAGFAVIEIYTPWYWAGVAGREMRFGRAVRRYGFDHENCRMLDRWWPAGHMEQSVTQSLRCYSPEDLKNILRGTGLKLESVESRGMYDHERERFVEHVPLDQAMQYLARLVPEDGRDF